MTGSAVIVSVRVPVPPARAFDVFTADIARWWRPHSLFRLGGLTGERLRFEEGPPRRLVAGFDHGGTFEVGAVEAWVPGERLEMAWRFPGFTANQRTTVEVLFEPIGGGTRVTVHHRGWDGIPEAHVARHGFPLQAIQARQADHWRALLARFAAGLPG